ncbi:MAG: hypothetical protein AAF447_14990 [Myxococcota bacterium]
MNRTTLATSATRALTLGGALFLLAGCEQPASDLNIERLPAVQPSLPSVPTLPPPPQSVTHDDGSYTIWGVRNRIGTTLDTELAVKGRIVQIYLPPECEEEPCARPAAPHMWIADDAGEDDQDEMLMVVGYAENQEAIDDAVELAARGRYEPPDPESGLLPIPTDFTVGNLVKVSGRFARTGGGFNNSEGLVEYRGHETLEAVDTEE